ncbi:hypothetical protein SESBI_39953 [Sesbania bispinosa]|nr:hypothetical protein SESBI_39953 [Sesbania bispinosa]
MIEGERVGAIREPNDRFGVYEGALGGVVTGEFVVEKAEDDGVDGIKGRGETHLSIDEVKDKVLALAANIVILEEYSAPLEKILWLVGYTYNLKERIEIVFPGGGVQWSPHEMGWAGTTMKMALWHRWRQHRTKRMQSPTVATMTNGGGAR